MTDALDRIQNLFLQGGPTMYPIVLLSVISVAISIERAVFWARQHGPGRSMWVARMLDLLRAGDEAGARALIGRDTSLYARAAEALLDPNVARRPGVMEIVEDARQSAERFSAVLSTIITASPLLGILGTVLGIIKSFDLLGSTERVTDITVVAAGIAEALITTAAGLIVALVTLFPSMAFRASAHRCLGGVEALAEAAHHVRAISCSRSSS
jgi:biopolymer transport protein ExbB